MIKHIVLWKVPDQPDGTSAEEAAGEMKRRLETLRGRIPGLLHLEVGIDIAPPAGFAGVALYSELTDADALAGYQAHPAHVEVADYVRSLGPERHVVDYEA